MTQAASSFVNRVSPANIGGMALTPGSCRKTASPPGAGVAAVGVNALMGAVAHLILLVTSVQAFGGRAGIAEIGAVYLGAAAIAAACPTPAAWAPSRPPWSRA